MKLIIIKIIQRKIDIAPFTGAWIETESGTLGVGLQHIAPFTGAWIETSLYLLVSLIGTIAPFTGAWIETTEEDRMLKKLKSHPSRVRGLKPE